MLKNKKSKETTLKITKVIQGECLQFEVNKAEFELIQMALGDYYCFLEYSLKNNQIRSNSSADKPYPLTEKIKTRFKKKFKILKPMIEMVHLFY